MFPGGNALLAKVRRAAVLAGFVGLSSGVAGAGVSGQVEKPRVAASLETVSVTVGSPVSVDLSEVFGGPVESYSAASTDTGVVSVSVSGSVMTVSGVAAGSQAVRVTATNSAGSSSVLIQVRVFDSTVSFPPSG